MSKSTDQARDLADQFKREGHLDKLKENILSRKLPNSDGDSVDQLIRKEVSDLVKSMILEDETLLFKNRGSTSALLEAQLIKGGYEKLGQTGGALNIEDYVQAALSDSQLLEEIHKNLLQMLINTDDSR